MGLITHGLKMVVPIMLAENAGALMTKILSNHLSKAKEEWIERRKERISWKEREREKKRKNMKWERERERERKREILNSGV